ncbi:response regulator transcription factor, partial [bacterium]|nr:response regulator transcription factor [bacterium]
MINQIPTLIIDTEQQSLELLFSFLKKTDITQVIGSYSDLVNGYNAVLELRPSIVIVDISQKTDLAIDIVSKIAVNHKTCKIIVTSDDYSADLVVKAMRAGAREFLSKPIIEAELNASLEK